MKTTTGLRALLMASAALGFAGCATAQTPEAQFTSPEAVEQKTDESFSAWTARFMEEAVSRGYSQDLVSTAFAGVVHPDPVVVDRSQSQPEFVRPVWEYLNSAVSESRVASGQAELSAQPELFAGLEAEYGLDREVLTAIWGLESAFGQILGDYDVFRSLATLGWAGWRPDFVEEQLFAALDILRDGEATRDQLKGSWAGAMGQTQFIPASYRIYAQDWDGDGRKNIWSDDGDALASAANLLARSGWKQDVPWGVEVRLTEEFNWDMFDGQERLTANWAQGGVARADGAQWGTDLWGLDAELILPAGAQGPAFLTFSNFDAIMRYNNSTAYALAVGMLSDVYAGRGGLVADWPDEGRPLRRAEVYELQDSLTALGFDTQGSDGLIGPNTRKAVRAFQRANAITPDGHVNSELLDRVRAAEPIQ